MRSIYDLSEGIIIWYYTFIIQNNNEPWHAIIVVVVVVFLKAVRVTARGTGGCNNCLSLIGFQIWNFPQQKNHLIGLRSDLKTVAGILP